MVLLAVALAATLQAPAQGPQEVFTGIVARDHAEVTAHLDTEGRLRLLCETMERMVELGKNVFAPDVLERTGRENDVIRQVRFYFDVTLANLEGNACLLVEELYGEEEDEEKGKQ